MQQVDSYSMLQRGVNFIFHTISTSGGVGRVIVDLVAEFVRRGIPVRIIAMRADKSVLPDHGIELVLLPSWRPLQRWANLTFENNALRFCKDDWLTISASRVVGGPVDIAIVGGTHLKHLKRKGKKSIGFWDKKILAHERIFYDNAKFCVAHSRITADELIELGVPEPKVKCLFPPTDISVFNLQSRDFRKAMREEWVVSPETFCLAFPSNNHDLKGADLILQAIEPFGGKIRLVVASKRPIDNPFALNIGFQKNMAPIYAASDSTILASKYEAFGLVAVESILCGTPVLLSDVCGAKDALIEPGCRTFLRDVNVLSDALKIMLEKFKAGTLVLKHPEQSILYPYSMSLHVDALLKLVDFK